MKHGRFPHCQKLRDEAANASLKDRQLKAGDSVLVPDHTKKKKSGKVKKKYRFLMKKRYPAKIRIVHGSKYKAWKSDHALTELRISSYRTDKGGLKQNKAFPSDYGFKNDAHVDPHTFKIEVTDSTVSGDTLDVTLEALKPTYDDDGVTGHEPFPGDVDDADKRKVTITCKRVKKKSKIFRSKYLRLVTDTGDFAAASDQALLVTDTADGAAGAADRVEILDQEVRATYAVPDCPCKDDAAKACTAVVQLPVGTTSRHRRIKMTVNVLRKTRGGTPMITATRARRVNLTYNRRIFAQAGMSVKLLDFQVREVEPPANLIAIENKKGRRSTLVLRKKNRKKIKMKIEVDPDDKGGSTTKTIEYTIGSRDKPATTARKLAAHIAKEMDGKVSVTHGVNPRLPGNWRGSADVVIGDPLKQKVVIDDLESTDAKHTVELGFINNGEVEDFGNDNMHAGTVKERTLIRNYDSGSDRVDLFVCEKFIPDRGYIGEAFSIGRKEKRWKRPLPYLVNSVIVVKNTVKSPDQYQTVIAHEIGHLLTDLNHEIKVGGVAARANWELMYYAAPTNGIAIDAPKRISNSKNRQMRALWDAKGGKHNPVTIMRSGNRNLLESW